MSVDAVKQVILVRRDLGMNRGKEISQGAHASMMWLTLRLRECGHHGQMSEHSEKHIDGLQLSPAEFRWVHGLFTKIVVQVPDETSLLVAVENARLNRLQAHIVEDAGLTQFKGVKTKTCAAIGPDWASLIDPITRELKLY